jgi:hypothetical protein
MPRAGGLRTQNEARVAFDWASWGTPFEPQGKAVLCSYRCRRHHSFRT